MYKKSRLNIWSFASVIVLMIYLVFMVYPLFGIIKESIFDESTGLFTLNNFQKFFSKPYYIGAIKNSLLVTVCVTAATILVASTFS